MDSPRQKLKTETVRLEPGMGAAVTTTGSFAGCGYSLASNLEQGLRQILEVSNELKTTAEKVFAHIDENLEDNVFLNVPNLIQLLVLLSTVGHTLPSIEIKQLLFNTRKKTDSGTSVLEHSETARLVCSRASRDLMAWEMHIRQQCLFNEYQTRRRLFVNRQACRSFSFRTFKALNSLVIEVKISGGATELNRWAMGAEKAPPGIKNVFKIWESEEEKEKTEEKNKKSKETEPAEKMLKRKDKQPRDATLKEQRVSRPKCPILMIATQFEIPVHPFVLDMRSIYTIGSSPSPLRAVRFINDSSKMLKHYKIGREHRGVRIPCRLKDCNTSMELMVFWSSKNGSKKYYNVLTLVDAVMGGLESKSQYNGIIEETAVKEIHLPLWEQSNEAQNIAYPISKSITDHLFTEGGFGDLADMHDARPNADPNCPDPPSLQSFDYITIRTPNEEGMTPKDLDQECPEGKGVVRVNLPYYMIVYDNCVKCPIYYAKVSKPMTAEGTMEHEKGKWKFPCCVM